MRITKLNGDKFKCHAHGRNAAVKAQIKMDSVLKALANKARLIADGKGANGRSMNAQLRARHMRTMELA